MKRYTEQVFTRLTKGQQRAMKRFAKKWEQNPSEYIRTAILNQIARDTEAK